MDFMKETTVEVSTKITYGFSSGISVWFRPVISLVIYQGVLSRIFPENLARISLVIPLKIFRGFLGIHP